MAVNINEWPIDFDRWVKTALFLGVVPKMTRENRDVATSPQVQAKSHDGIPKWTCTIALPVKLFDQDKFVNIEITLTSKEKPCESIAVGTQVTCENLIMGGMPQKNGYTHFYAAEAIKPKVNNAGKNLNQYGQ